jgi:hypothetical protein
VVSLVNGCLVGKDRLELSGLWRVMLTSWRTMKDTRCRKVDWWYKEARTVKGNRSV